MILSGRKVIGVQFWSSEALSKNDWWQSLIQSVSWLRSWGRGHCHSFCVPSLLFQGTGFLVLTRLATESVWYRNDIPRFSDSGVSGGLITAGACSQQPTLTPMSYTCHTVANLRSGYHSGFRSCWGEPQNIKTGFRNAAQESVSIVEPLALEILHAAMLEAKDLRMTRGRDSALSSFNSRAQWSLVLGRWSSTKVAKADLSDGLPYLPSLRFTLKARLLLKEWSLNNQLQSWSCRGPWKAEGVVFIFGSYHGKLKVVFLLAPSMEQCWCVLPWTGWHKKWKSNHFFQRGHWRKFKGSKTFKHYIGKETELMPLCIYNIYVYIYIYICVCVCESSLEGFGFHKSFVKFSSSWYFGSSALTQNSKICLVSPPRTHPGLGGGLVAFPRTLQAQYELGFALVARWSVCFGGPLWYRGLFRFHYLSC